MRYKCQELVTLKGNPLCRGTIVSRRIPNTREKEAVYAVQMENGIKLRARTESSLEPSHYVSNGGWAMPVWDSKPHLKLVAAQNHAAAQSVMEGA